MIVTGKRGDLQIVARPPQPQNSWTSLRSDTFAGRDVTPEGALAIAHVYGAVRLVSTAAGTLPLEVLDETKKSRTVVTGGRVAPMLRYRPNMDTNAAVIWSLMVTHLMLRGNGYLAKVRDDAGNVVELYPINPQLVNPFRDATGTKKFRVLSFAGERYVDTVFGAEDILHIIGPSIDDGLRGASPISIVRNRLGVQNAQSEAQGRYYSQGMHAKGVLTMPPGAVTTPENMQRIREQWSQQNHGLDNAGLTPILPGGLQYQSVSLSPADSQFIETMHWGATEIATIFSIPASRLNANSGKGAVQYANVGQDDVHFVKQAVLPMLAYIESALNMDADLFGYMSAWVPRFNATAALRADDMTRFAGYQIATGGQPWMNTQEVRDAEGLGLGGPPPIAAPAAVPAPADSAQRSEQRSIDDIGMRSMDLPAMTFQMPEQPAPIVNITVPEHPAPVVNVAAAEAPIVTVNVPEQPASIVNVNVPDQGVPVVNVAAPNVTLTPEITIQSDPASSKRVKLERDARGNLIGATVEES